MYKNPVITIARQYGSGGREIGEKVAELLGIKAYGRELIDMAAQKSGYHPEMLQKADELPAEKSKEIQQAILLFKSLRELGENLPDEAKDEFLKSTNRMKIDYIINRLSGNLGLLKVAQKMRDDGAVVNYVKDSEVPIDYNGKKLAKTVLSAMIFYRKDLMNAWNFMMRMLRRKKAV